MEKHEEKLRQQRQEVMDRNNYKREELKKDLEKQIERKRIRTTIEEE